MTERDAKEELRRPLTFGDDAQIRAIRFLDSVQEAVDAIRESPECEECQGRGEIEVPSDDLDADDDEWDSEVCEICGGLGHFVTDWPACKDDVMKAATQRIMRDHLHV